jgi:Protein of unknown function (DUF2934)
MRLRELARLSEVLEETCSRSQALICEPQDRSHHDPGRSGSNATPRIGLDPGHQIDDEPSGSDQHPGPSEERIRRRAPEIWGRGGRSGDSQEHWYRAERKLAATQQEQPKPKEEAPAPGKASPGMAQVSNQKVPRPDKMSGRSVPDDSSE